LLRVDRVRAQGIIILCFNRFASLEIRRRLWALVGKDASFVTIQTFHGLALRILGRTMADIEKSDGQGKLTFDQLIPEANRMLRSDEVPIGMDSEEFRNRLVGSLSHILVDTKTSGLMLTSWFP
jgi:ATP-dependent DNA helicase RecQ